MFRKLTLLALLLTLAALLLGSDLRTSNAGLACPDWPTCHGQWWLTAPPADAATSGLFDLAKAQKALAHRYIAAGAGCLVFILVLLAWWVRERRAAAVGWSLFALVLLVAQVALSRWLILEQLPALGILGHLLLGSLTLVALYRLYLATGPSIPPLGDTRGLRLWATLAALLLGLEILLGGWVAANHAGLVCPDFPQCRGAWWPDADFAGSLDFLNGLTSQAGGPVSGEARIAMHWLHRLGALLVFVLLSGLATSVSSNPKVPRLSKVGLLLSALLLVEVGLGIGSVIWRLPEAIVVGHQGVAMLMLLVVVHIHYRLKPSARPADLPVALPTETGGSARLDTAIVEPAPLPTPPTPPVAPSRENLFLRLKGQLGKTRGGLSGVLGQLGLGRKAIDRDLLEELESQLLMADLGVGVTQNIIQHLTESLERHELNDGAALTGALKSHLFDLLAPVSRPLDIPQRDEPFVILVVGVNGVGKTTTIGKLAQRLKNRGKSVMLAAGDTFRAAAVEQLQTWGARNDVPVIAQHSGADSASVIYDGLQAAQARGVDVLIADTAGRLHTKSNLMEELSKIKRIMSRLDPNAPHEVLLVLDAGTGQNAISQARQFNESVHVTGLALTKLDGTAKGGVIFALASQFGIPIRYIGIGEGIEDLQDFDAKSFVDALFAEG